MAERFFRSHCCRSKNACLGGSTSANAWANPSRVQIFQRRNEENFINSSPTRTNSFKVIHVSIGGSGFRVSRNLIHQDAGEMGTPDDSNTLNSHSRWKKLVLRIPEHGAALLGVHKICIRLVQAIYYQKNTTSHNTCISTLKTKYERHGKKY